MSDRCLYMQASGALSLGQLSGGRESLSPQLIFSVVGVVGQAGFCHTVHSSADSPSLGTWATQATRASKAQAPLPVVLATL